MLTWQTDYIAGKSNIKILNKMQINLNFSGHLSTYLYEKKKPHQVFKYIYIYIYINITIYFLIYISYNFFNKKKKNKQKNIKRALRLSESPQSLISISPSLNFFKSYTSKVETKKPTCLLKK